MIKKVFNLKGEGNMANKTNEINYNETISFLFQSYLINTYSHYLSNGGEKLSSNFTTMAKYQPYSFGQFCTYLQQGHLPLSSGNFVAENNHLINAQKTLQSSIYDQAYLSDCCSILSLVYDCALANSQSLQEYLKQSKLDIRKAELSVSGLKDLKNNCEINPYFAFSNSGYERSGGALLMLKK